MGLIVFSLELTLKHLHMIEVPEFFFGLAQGLALSLMLIGAFYYSPGLIKIRNFKNSILKK